jgi:plasmid stabilization system protein ParE
MATKPSVRRIPAQKTFEISPNYTQKLLEIAEYGYEMFGAKVSNSFIAKIESKVMTLPKMPDRYPKSRFVESTDKKTYRNILIEKYAVLYSVTARTINVITIYHQSINPDKIRSYV